MAKASPHLEFEHRRPHYEKLRQSCDALIAGLLSAEGVLYHKIESRVKSAESFRSKINRKKYIDPLREITDLCGIRIIVYLESDISMVEEIIRNAFEIDEEKSVNKLMPDSANLVGYRSLHLICRMGDARGSLPEYAALAAEWFEVQVRTTLQHAWAEIEHDRNYKLDGSLPPDLQRRLALAAATLEMVDREFAQIAEAADAYAERIKREPEGRTGTEPLSGIAISSVIRKKMQQKDLDAPLSVHAKHDASVVRELSGYGINTISEFANLIDRSPYFEELAQAPNTEIGLIRDLMMYEDIEKYFDHAYDRSWHGLDERDYEKLVERYNSQKVDGYLEKYGLDIVTEEMCE